MRSLSSGVRLAASALAPSRVKRPSMVPRERAEMPGTLSPRSDKRLERRRAVAGARHLAGEVARGDAHRLRLLADHRGDQPQGRPPALERLAEIVDGDGIGDVRRLERLAGAGDDVAQKFRHRAGGGVRMRGGFASHAACSRMIKTL